MSPGTDILWWTGESLRYLDQTLLPNEESVDETGDYESIVISIQTLQIRGAPLIGIAAAYACVMAAMESRCFAPEQFRERTLLAFDEIAEARPTAVNLRWAVEQCRSILLATDDMNACIDLLEKKAIALHQDDARSCALIGQHGASLIPQGAGIVTHCNTGALATGGEGTAMAAILEAHRQNKGIHVFVDETRPLLQGARLTMWELRRHGVPATLITDSMAASIMRSGRVQLAITGADRIAANGDTANKIGTYGLAIAAKAHGLPFYIAAPLSTVDVALPDGDAIPIEERDEAEVTHFLGARIAPERSRAFNPAFDVTPHSLITAIVTERGIFTPPYAATLSALVS